MFWFSYSDYKRFKNADYHIVSLGNTCLTRALTVALALKPRRFYGEKSGPFDLCVTENFKQVVDLIQNDFAHFFENINLENFPHDEKFNFIQFKKRYTDRIQNFLDITNSDKKVYYIYSNFTQTLDAEEVKRLYEILKAKRKSKPFKLILLLSKPVDVPEVIQITDDITINDPKVIEYIIDRYKIYHNKYTDFRDRMSEQLKNLGIF